MIEAFMRFLSAGSGRRLEGLRADANVDQGALAGSSPGCPSRRVGGPARAALAALSSSCSSRASLRSRRSGARAPLAAARPGGLLRVAVTRADRLNRVHGSPQARRHACSGRRACRSPPGLRGFADLLELRARARTPARSARAPRRSPVAPDLHGERPHETYAIDPPHQRAHGHVEERRAGLAGEVAGEPNAPSPPQLLSRAIGAARAGAM